MECLKLPEPCIHWWPNQTRCLCVHGHSHSQEGLAVPPLVPSEGINKLWCSLPSFPCPWVLEPHFSLAFIPRLCVCMLVLSSAVPGWTWGREPDLNPFVTLCFPTSNFCILLFQIFCGLVQFFLAIIHVLYNQDSRSEHVEAEKLAYLAKLINWKQ